MARGQLSPRKRTAHSDRRVPAGRQDEKSPQDHKGHKRHRHCFTEQTARSDRDCPRARHEMIKQSCEARSPDASPAASPTRLHREGRSLVTSTKDSCHSLFQRKDEPVREKDEPIREFGKQSCPAVSKGSPAPISSGRRTLLAGMAASCARITASALAPKNFLG